MKDWKRALAGAAASLCLASTGLMASGCADDDSSDAAAATTAADSTDGTDGSTSVDATDGATDATDGATDATDGATDGATDATDGATDATDATDGATDATDGVDGMDETDGTDGTDTAAAATFVVRVENVSGNSELPTPFAPGVYTVTSDADPFFTAGEIDRGMGLEALAEDGSPVELVESLGDDAGAFAVPAGADEPAPIFPGMAYEFEVTAEPGDGDLHLATMLVQSNDLFVGTGSTGIALFDEDGMPLPERDVTDQVSLWDAGTEINEAPGQGPWQAPRQAGADSGPAEGVIHMYGHTTRALPPASQMAEVAVTLEDGTYTLTVNNVSAASGAIMTPLAPVFYAIHDNTWSLFETGAAASPGLEVQAEDGSPMVLVQEHTDAPGVAMAGAAAVGNGAEDAGPIGPGGSYTFSVTPTEAAGYLTLSFMVVQSNDAFIAPTHGIPLLNEDGTPRSAMMVEADLRSQLAVWDAGTELNEVPGFGPNQPMRQAAANTGNPELSEMGVVRYGDHTNDLAADMLDKFAVEITNGEADGEFDVKVRNLSADSAFPAILTPTLWVLHNSEMSLFEMGTKASPALEALSEDGNATVWADEFAAAELGHGVLAMATTMGEGPLMPGDMYEGTITVTADAPYFSFATMVVPSNDTFLSVLPGGVALLDDEGNPRSNEDIAADLAEAIRAFDSGTEANQAGAMGPDMAPHQAGPNTGAAEGDGTVRLFNDPVWSYPTAADTLRITVTPKQ